MASENILTQQKIQARNGDIQARLEVKGENWQARERYLAIRKRACRRP